MQIQKNLYKDDIGWYKWISVKLLDTKYKTKYKLRKLSSLLFVEAFIT